MPKTSAEYRRTWIVLELAKQQFRNLEKKAFAQMVWVGLTFTPCEVDIVG
jgi:hypothetical protein